MAEAFIKSGSNLEGRSQVHSHGYAYGTDIYDMTLNSCRMERHPFSMPVLRGT